MHVKSQDDSWKLVIDKIVQKNLRKSCNFISQTKVKQTHPIDTSIYVGPDNCKEKMKWIDEYNFYSQACLERGDDIIPATALLHKKVIA